MNQLQINNTDKENVIQTVQLLNSFMKSSSEPPESEISLLSDLLASESTLQDILNKIDTNIDIDMNMNRKVVKILSILSVLSLNRRVNLMVGDSSIKLEESILTDYVDKLVHLNKLLNLINNSCPMDSSFEYVLSKANLVIPYTLIVSLTFKFTSNLSHNLNQLNQLFKSCLNNKYLYPNLVESFKNSEFSNLLNKILTNKNIGFDYDIHSSIDLYCFRYFPSINSTFQEIRLNCNEISIGSNIIQLLGPEKIELVALMFIHNEDLFNMLFDLRRSNSNSLRVILKTLLNDVSKCLNSKFAIPISQNMKSKISEYIEPCFTQDLSGSFKLFAEIITHNSLDINGKAADILHYDLEFILFQLHQRNASAMELHLIINELGYSCTLSNTFVYLNHLISKQLLANLGATSRLSLTIDRYISYKSLPPISKSNFLVDDEIKSNSDDKLIRCLLLNLEILNEVLDGDNHSFRNPNMLTYKLETKQLNLVLSSLFSTLTLYNEVFHLSNYNPSLFKANLNNKILSGTVRVFEKLIEIYGTRAMICLIQFLKEIVVSDLSYIKISWVLLNHLLIHVKEGSFYKQMTNNEVLMTSYRDFLLQFDTGDSKYAELKEFFEIPAIEHRMVQLNVDDFKKWLVHESSNTTPTNVSNTIATNNPTGNMFGAQFNGYQAAIPNNGGNVPQNYTNVANTAKRYQQPKNYQNHPNNQEYYNNKSNATNYANYANYAASNYPEQHPYNNTYPNPLPNNARSQSIHVDEFKKL